MPEIACVVLAAGRSARMGRPKQLLTWQGEPLVRRVLAEVCASRCRHVALVLGAHAPAVAESVRGLRATLLHNPLWSRAGLSSSIHVAVHWAQAISADALLLCVGDQPHLSAAQLERLCVRYVRERGAVASAYGGTLGVPAIFDQAWFASLLALRGDRGAASLLRHGARVSQVAWPEGAIDLDTPHDVVRHLPGS